MDEHCSTHASCAPPPPPPPSLHLRPPWTKMNCKRWQLIAGRSTAGISNEFLPAVFLATTKHISLRLLCQICGFACYVKTLNQGRICQTKLQLLTHFNLAIGVGVWWKGGLLLARGRVFEGHYHWHPPPPLAEKRTQSGAKKLPIPKFSQGVLYYGNTIFVFSISSAAHCMMQGFGFWLKHMMRRNGVK